MSYDIKIGDLVWARMRSYPAWPGRVVKPGPNTKKPTKKDSEWIYFFGSCNYAWVERHAIHPYHEKKEAFSTLCTWSSFKEAIMDIEDFIEKKNNDPSYELNVAEVVENNVTPKKSPAKKPAKKASLGTKRSSTDSPKLSTSSKRVRKSSTKSDENGVDLGSEILNIPQAPDRPASPTVDINNLSDLLKTKNIVAADRTFGFLGVGIIGSGIVKNLINSGHRVNLWSRSLSKCEEIKKQADINKAGLVNTYQAPCDVVQNSDIIFSCVSDPRTAMEVVHGNCGVIHLALDGDALEGKGYVEMTGIDPETSKDISDIIRSKGGRYLEAQVQGSKTEADEGNLVVLTAGDKTLFLDCQSCFKAMGKTAFFLGDVGYATKVNLILQLMKGISLVGLAECLALADRCGISSKEVINIFKLTSMACPYLSNKADLIIEKDFSHVEQAIQHMQKDMKMALDISDRLKQPLLMTSTANEVFKHARRLGYDGHDVSCIYMRTRH